MNPSTCRFASRCSGPAALAVIAVLLAAPRTAVRAQESRAAWIRPLASAVVPGTGQLLGRRDRGALYLVLETYLVARFLAENREGGSQASQYRTLAFQVARRAFGPAERDTAFGYFEEMGKFIESGPFDVDPGSALVPPADERTFNGHIWRLARETFFPRPDSFPAADTEEYQRALEFYRRRAVGPGFQWSWRGAALEHDLFRQSIRASDRAFRAATQHLGALLANHVLSAVDAFVSHRLGPEGRTVGIRGVVSPGTGGERSRMRLAVGIHAPF